MATIEALFASPWGWLIAGLVIAGLEIVAPGVFLLWVGVGAIAVGLMLWLFPDLAVTGQLLVFALAMLGSIGLGFGIQRRSGPRPGSEEINQELRALVGRRFEAATDFSAGRGRIRVGDTTYGAESEHAIRAGTTVTVVSVTNGRLCVSAHEAHPGDNGCENQSSSTDTSLNESVPATGRPRQQKS